MKVLVTGGTGFIGSHLVDRLQSEGGVEVYALVRDPRRLKGLDGKPGVKILKGDLFSVPPLPSPIDAVFHLAGVTKSADSKEYYTVNQKGTASFLRSILDQGQRPRIIHLSSLAAAGPSAQGSAVRECDPPRPVSPYGESKLLGEREALAFSDRMPVTVLRVAAVYGPGDEDFLMYFKYIRKGLMPLFGKCPRPLSLCYVQDLVRAMMICLRSDAAPGEIFNIADAQPYAWDDLGRAAGRALGMKPVAVRIPVRMAGIAAAFSEAVCRVTRKPSPLNLSKYRDMRQPGWVADVAKARDILGFRTEYTLEGAVRETIEWYLREGRL
jgi:dihydroflavonol-4-reductase